MRTERSQSADKGHDKRHAGLTTRTVVLTAALAMLTVLAFGSVARSQEEGTVEQWKKKYDDAVTQLKATQNRTKELDDEKGKLAAQVADLQKQLAAVTADRDRLQREQEEQADKTFFLRSHYAAWEAFIRQYPELKAKWKAYLETDFISPRRGMPKIVDPDWPTSTES